MNSPNLCCKLFGRQYQNHLSMEIVVLLLFYLLLSCVVLKVDHYQQFFAHYNTLSIHVLILATITEDVHLLPEFPD